MRKAETAKPRAFARTDHLSFLPLLRSMLKHQGSANLKSVLSHLRKEKIDRLGGGNQA